MHLSLQLRNRNLVVVHFSSEWCFFSIVSLFPFGLIGIHSSLFDESICCHCVQELKWLLCLVGVRFASLRHSTFLNICFFCISQTNRVVRAIWKLCIGYLKISGLWWSYLSLKWLGLNLSFHLWAWQHKFISDDIIRSDIISRSTLNSFWCCPMLMNQHWSTHAGLATTCESRWILWTILEVVFLVSLITLNNTDRKWHK